MGIQYETEWGILGVGTFRDRKRPCLYLETEPGTARVLAIFHGDDEAAAFSDFMGRIAEASNQMAQALAAIADERRPNAQEQGDPVGREEPGGSG